MFRLLESPTFVHSVEIFDMFQARCVEVNMATFKTPREELTAGSAGSSWHSWEAGTTW